MYIYISELKDWSDFLKLLGVASDTIFHHPNPNFPTLPPKPWMNPHTLLRSLDIMSRNITMSKKVKIVMTQLFIDMHN